MIRVLFVCLGNICRSPMAEAVFQHLVDEAGVSAHFHIDSAGTGDWHVGELAHRGTRDVLQKHHIPYDGRARQFTSQDWLQFDYLLAMDESNLEAMVRRAPKPTTQHTDGSYQLDGSSTQARLFLDYAHADKATTIRQVPDPYYTGKYDETYDLVRMGAQALLKYLRHKHQL